MELGAGVGVGGASVWGFSKCMQLISVRRGHAAAQSVFDTLRRLLPLGGGTLSDEQILWGYEASAHTSPWRADLPRQARARSVRGRLHELERG